MFMWIIYAFASAFFAGVTSILAKCGIRKTDSNVATAIRTIVVLLFSWVMVFLVGSQATLSKLTGESLLYLVQMCIRDRRKDVIECLERWYTPELSPQHLAAMLVNAALSLCLDSPDDDITALVFKMRRRQAVNVIIGPPADPKDDERVLKLFFAKEGRHVVCGGTTAHTCLLYTSGLKRKFLRRDALLAERLLHCGRKAAAARKDAPEERGVIELGFFHFCNVDPACREHGLHLLKGDGIIHELLCLRVFRFGLFGNAWPLSLIHI